jgi:serine/threonine-protein kinase ULK4
VKTIENISSQSISTGYKFATQEVFSVLINQFLVTKNDNLKVSCVVSIANLVLLDNNQVELALYGIGLKNIV